MQNKTLPALVLTLSTFGIGALTLNSVQAFFSPPPPRHMQGGQNGQMMPPPPNGPGGSFGEQDQQNFGPPPQGGFDNSQGSSFGPPNDTQSGQTFGPPSENQGGFPGGQSSTAADLPSGVSTTENWVEITTDGSYRYINSNGLPDHDTGEFPNSGNPNTISAQYNQFKVPLNPVYTGNQTDSRMPGVALNGVKFDPGTAEAWQNDRSSGWNYEAIQNVLNLGLDFNLAHVQPTGAYHYHGVSKELVASLPSDSNGTQIGWAADGFPIYYQAGVEPSYRLKSGTRPENPGPGGSYNGAFTQDYEYVDGLGDLDECNGTWIGDEYVYYATDDFPFFPRCSNGTPDSSFSHGGGPGNPGGQAGPGGARGPQMGGPNNSASQSAGFGQRPSNRQPSQNTSRPSITRSVNHTTDGITINLTSAVAEVIQGLQARELPEVRSDKISLSKSNIDDGIALAITSTMDEVIQALQAKFPEN